MPGLGAADRRGAAFPLVPDVLAVALLVGIGLWVDLHSFRTGLDLLDEGFEVQMAWRILHGQIPYRDFFTVTTPLAFFWEALLIRLVGPGLIVGRISNLLTALATAILIYTIAKDTSRPLALCAAATAIPLGLPVVPRPSYSWYAVLLLLLVLWRALRAGQGSGRWWSVGLLCALTVLCKQNVGAPVALGAFGYAFWRGGRPAVIGYLAGFLSPLVVFFGYLALAGAIPAFWNEAVRFALGSYPHLAYVPYPRPMDVWRALVGHRLPVGVDGDIELFAFLPPLVLGGGALVLGVGAITRAQWLPDAALVWFFTLAGWAIAFPRSDDAHIAFALPAAWAGAAWLLGRVVHRHVWALSAALVVALSLFGFVWPRHLGPWRQGVAVGLSRAQDILTTPIQVAQVRAMVAGIDRAVPPGQPVLVLPRSDLLYYLAQRPNPTPYDLVIPLNMPTDGYAQIAAVMVRTHVTVFLWPNDGLGGNFNVYAQDIARTLDRDYVLSGSAGPLQIWRWA